MYIIVRMVNKPLIMNIVLNFQAVLPNDKFIYRKTFNFLISLEVYGSKRVKNILKIKPRIKNDKINRYLVKIFYGYSFFNYNKVKIHFILFFTFNSPNLKIISIFIRNHPLG